MKRLKNIVPQFSKFMVVGVLNTAIDFFVFNLIAFFTGITAGVGAAIITSISFTVANINSYFFNKNWTFKAAAHGTKYVEKKDAVKFGEFFSVSIIGLLINAITVLMITAYIPAFLGISFFADMLNENTALAWANIAKVVAIGLSLIWNFIGYKLIVFKK